MLALLLGCGRASAPAEAAACHERRTALEREITAAAEARSCTSDDECVAIAGPHHPASDYERVVHADDRDRLEALVKAHYEACGLGHHEALDVFVVVEPKCEGHCVAVQTVLHLE